MTLLTRPPTGPLTARAVRVVDVRRETADTFTLGLDTGGDPFAFEPGQFNMLYAFGIGESAISISSDADRSDRLEHTIRSVGAVTAALTATPAGSMIGLRGPFGTAWPVARATGGHLVIVAGGIGLAPLRPAILRAVAERDRFAGVTVIVGARTPRDLLFTDDLAAWAADERVDLRVTVDRAEVGWDGRVGVVTRYLDPTTFDPGTTTVLTCGPEVMMRATAMTLLDAGVPADRVHVSLERNMRCAVGTCGHCQLGPVLVCRDGPVFAWPSVARLLEVREL